jgi:hypothetical protein
MGVLERLGIRRSNRLPRGPAREFLAPQAQAESMSLRRSIAPDAPGGYPTRMASAVLRLLALFALIFMPLSMASAPASAQPSAAAPSGHCDDHQKPSDAPAGQQMHCTGCAALPAMDAPFPISELQPQTPMELTLVELPAGIVPETATPPPKLV